MLDKIEVEVWVKFDIFLMYFCVNNGEPFCCLKPSKKFEPSFLSILCAVFGRKSFGWNSILCCTFKSHFVYSKTHLKLIVKSRLTNIQRLPLNLRKIPRHVNQCILKSAKSY